MENFDKSYSPKRSEYRNCESCGGEGCPDCYGFGFSMKNPEPDSNQVQNPEPDEATKKEYINLKRSMKGIEDDDRNPLYGEMVRTANIRLRELEREFPELKDLKENKLTTMEKKLITEMKFMMERLENPRMTYTEYEKKHKLLTEDSEIESENLKIRKFLEKASREEKDVIVSFDGKDWYDKKDRHYDVNQLPKSTEEIEVDQKQYLVNFKEHKIRDFRWQEGKKLKVRSIKPKPLFETKFMAERLEDKPVSKEKKFINEACLTISKDMNTTGNVFDVNIKPQHQGVKCESSVKPGVFTMDLDNKTVKTKNGPNVTFDELVAALKQFKLVAGGETNAYDQLIKLIELGWGTTKF